MVKTQSLKFILY